MTRPKCEECNEEMHRYTDPNIGRNGWSCDSCGWSWDDEQMLVELDHQRTMDQPNSHK